MPDNIIIATLGFIGALFVVLKPFLDLNTNIAELKTSIDNFKASVDKLDSRITKHGEEIENSKRQLPSTASESRI